MPGRFPDVMPIACGWLTLGKAEIATPRHTGPEYGAGRHETVTEIAYQTAEKQKKTRLEALFFKYRVILIRFRWQRLRAPKI